MSRTVQKTLIVLAINLAVLFIHGFLIAWGETREACYRGKALYDVFHSLSSEKVWPFSQISQIPVDLIIGILFIVVILIMIVHPQRFRLLRRYLVYHSIISLLRGVSVFITTIPSPTGWCEGRVIPPEFIFERTFGLTLGAIGLPVKLFGITDWGDTCCDMIISGHTSLIMIFALLIQYTLSKTASRTALWMLACFGLLGVTSSNLHYSIDVLITILICFGLDRIYSLSMAINKNRLIRWLEDGSTNPIQKFRTI